jgi:hypothetical protein
MVSTTMMLLMTDVVVFVVVAGGAVLVTSGVLYISTMISGKRGVESSYVEGEMIHVPWTVWDSVLIVFGSLVGQSQFWLFDCLID